LPVVAPDRRLGDPGIGFVLCLSFTKLFCLRQASGQTIVRGRVAAADRSPAFQGRELEFGHVQGAFGPYMECAGRARDGGPARRRRFDSARPKALWMRFSTSPSDPKRRRASLAAALQKAASRLRTAFVESKRECFKEGRIWQCWSGTLAHDRDLAGTPVAHLRPDPTLKCTNSRARPFKAGNRWRKFQSRRDD
jgi:hypothetical protein